MRRGVMNKIAKIYIGEHLPDEIANHMCDWLQNCLNKNIDSDTFRKEWIQYLEDMDVDKDNENRFVPGKTVYKNGDYDYWEDFLDFSDICDFHNSTASPGLAGFYNTAYKNKPVGIKVDYNDGYYNLIILKNNKFY